MKIQIELTPLEPYFLGNERGMAYGEVKTQRALANPYYIKSSRMPTQSAMFGVLRYLGIKSPTSDFNLTPEDQKNIGRESFQLLQAEEKTEEKTEEKAEEKQSFGRIKSISPVVLLNQQDEVLVAAPRNLYPDENKKFVPFQRFCEVLSGSDGRSRWLPEEYNEKNYESGGFFNLSTGAVEMDLFSTQTRVGINREMQRAEKDTGNKGFFKKEYVILKSGYRFMIQAEVEEEFLLSDTRTVFMGQGRTAFSVCIRKVSANIPWQGLDRVFPTVRETGCYLYVKSDLYFSGRMEQLRDGCMFSLTDSQEHRGFMTRYGSGNAESRYRKSPVLLRLIQAGSVFVFQNREQRQDFIWLLEQSDSFEHGQKAGFNQIYMAGEGTNES